MRDAYTPSPLRDLLAHEANFAQQMDKASDKDGRATDGLVWRRIAACKRELDVLSGKAALIDEVMTAPNAGRAQWDRIIAKWKALEDLRCRPAELETEGAKRP